MVPTQAAPSGAVFDCAKGPKVAGFLRLRVSPTIGIQCAWNGKYPSEPGRLANNNLIISQKTGDPTQTYAMLVPELIYHLQHRITA
jgi:hypothetical protein